MSGIVGIYHLDGKPVERETLERMNSTLAHRGPDASDVWLDGCVGLGHRMLWTTPESLHERLPLVSANSGFVLTADARIDNRDDLIATLGLQDAARDGLADSELILAAYEKWGEDCPARLIGDFAFAIWDPRKRSLFCARDPMGVKPFYYHLSDRFFVFGSEIRALLAIPEVPRRLNETRVADHLARMGEDRVITFYQDILRLPAAQEMTIGRGGAQPQCRPYWTLDSSRELRLGSDEEYAEAFRELFFAAVGSRLRSAFPVGSFLSGGLDSSSICCAAQRLLDREGKGQQLHTFSAIFPSLPESDLRLIDERRYAEAVVASARFKPHFIHADELSPVTDAEAMFQSVAEPMWAGNQYMHWAIYKVAHGEGARVLMDGIDGDVTVSHGYEHLAQLAMKGRFWALLAEARALARNSPGPRSAGGLLWRLGLRPLIPDRAARMWRRVRRRPVDSLPEERDLIHPDFAKRIHLRERARSFDAGGVLLSARESHKRGLLSPVYQAALELTDKAASAFSVESRYPFFDRRLMEFCVALPTGQKLRRGWTRSILRRAMEGILPKEVQWRIDKANLVPNLRRRLSDSDFGLVEKAIERGNGVIEQYVDVPVLKGAVDRYRNGGVSRTRDALAVLDVAFLALGLSQMKLEAPGRKTASVASRLHEVGHSGSNGDIDHMVHKEAPGKQ